MKTRVKGAIIAGVVIGLFLTPFFKPEIVPMRFHSNADYTKENFMDDMKEILTDEYDAIVEPEFVSGFTNRKGLNFYHYWAFEREINGDKYKMRDNVMNFYFNPPRNIELIDVIEPPITYLQKGKWGPMDENYIETSMYDFINTSSGLRSAEWHRELPSGNITHLKIFLNPGEVVYSDKI